MTSICGWVGGVGGWWVVGAGAACRACRETRGAQQAGRRQAPLPFTPSSPLSSHAQVLREVLAPLLARVQPQLVCYNAGVDVHGDDALGMLALTDVGILERDRFVLAACADAGAPVAAGGRGRTGRGNSSSLKETGQDAAGAAGEPPGLLHARLRCALVHTPRAPLPHPHWQPLAAVTARTMSASWTGTCCCTAPPQSSTHAWRPPAARRHGRRPARGEAASAAACVLAPIAPCT